MTILGALLLVGFLEVAVRAMTGALPDWMVEGSVSVIGEFVDLLGLEGPTLAGTIPPAVIVALGLAVLLFVARDLWTQ